jgi:hypothetical protein
MIVSHWLISISIYFNSQYEQHPGDNERQCVKRRRAVCSQRRTREKRTGNQTTSSSIYRERRKEREKAKKRRNWRLVFLLYMVSKAESKIDTLLEKNS